MTGPTWKLDDDKTHVTVEFPTSPPVAMRLDLASVEDMLRNLGEFRAQMEPQIPTTYALGQKVQAVPDPFWMTQPDLLQGHSLLHLRDPRFGWLHYLLPPHEAAKLATFLTKQAEKAAQPPDVSKRN